jgi:hypothetical protein
VNTVCIPVRKIPKQIKEGISVHSARWPLHRNMNGKYSILKNTKSIEIRNLSRYLPDGRQGYRNENQKNELPDHSDFYLNIGAFLVLDAWFLVLGSYLVLTFAPDHEQPITARPYHPI